MPRPRTASALFQSIWDRLDEIRRLRKLDPDAISKRCGFARSTWFVYGKRGNIPFHLLERVAHTLEVKLDARVVSGPTDAAALLSVREESVRDYLRRIAEEIEKFPQGRRELAADAAFAVLRELRQNPSWADAEQTGHRARSLK